MILVIDNYDSFTYNLVQLLGGITPSIEVRRNDEVSLDEVAALAPSHIVLSPGPGRPEEAGITVALVKRFASSIPILGVCLGHQAIGVAFGARVVHARSLMHGRTSAIHHAGDPLFRGVTNPCTATRYHSLVISPEGKVLTRQVRELDRGEMAAILQSKGIPHWLDIYGDHSKHDWPLWQRMEGKYF